jgi:hypothetical protein
MPTKQASSNRPGKSPRPHSAAPSDTAKHKALEQFREDSRGQVLTTDQGLCVNDDQNSLKVGAGSLLEDFILGEGVDSQMADRFIKAIARHRNWSREPKAQAIPA